MTDSELIEKLRWVREGHVLTEKYASPAAARIEALAARVEKLDGALKDAALALKQAASFYNTEHLILAAKQAIRALATPAIGEKDE